MNTISIIILAAVLLLAALALAVALRSGKKSVCWGCTGDCRECQKKKK